MAMVDAFQHWAHTHPEGIDPAACDARWAELQNRFMPGIDWSGLKAEMMTGWHRKLHIHTAPFYYVEYGLAQLGAVQVWRNALQNQAASLENYRRALALGVPSHCPAVSAAGAKFAFDARTLQEAGLDRDHDRATARMRTCLVLGATGFIGGHIAREAVARGWQVRALRRNPNFAGAIGDVDVEWVTGDVNNRSTLIEAMRGCEMIFHSAGAYPHGTRQIDRDVQSALNQMRNVIAVARDSKPDRLIYTSSFTTIGLPGDPDRLADERDLYRPGTAGDAYYEAKWAMEVEALNSGLPTVVLNPAAVFGPGDVHLSVSEIVIMAAKGRVPFYFDATFGAIDVRDVPRRISTRSIAGVWASVTFSAITT
jgi:uncharacterized protein YbjT (DUF2867 family)